MLKHILIIVAGGITWCLLICIKVGIETYMMRSKDRKAIKNWKDRQRW